ncbi:5-oxoprolinase (ATP-hydrolyzing), partial [Tremellales sp. Uapishka_1]
MTGNPMSQSAGVRIAIDRGGTFCDVWAFIPAWMYSPGKAALVGDAVIRPQLTDPKYPGVQITFKLLSVDPQNYSDAPAEGIRRVMQIVTGRTVRKGELIDTTGVDSVRMGTTVATNALLERKGARFGVVVTEGFRDVLEIGDQTRPDLFDLKISNKPPILYQGEDVVEASERVTLEGWTYNPQGNSVEQIFERARASDEPGVIDVGTSGEVVRVWKPLDEVRVRADLQQMYDQGVRSLAVALLFSYTYPNHELRIGEIAREIGFSQISLSSTIAPGPKIVPRGNSATLDAYISPVLYDYIDSFQKSFVGGKAGKRCDFMKSDGGLVASHKFTGLRALLSGPAGGVVGCAMTAYSERRKRPIVGFDMGGTSTDVCRYAGKFEVNNETLTAGIKVACPQLAIETVAAGGGSRLFYKNDLFVVGPESVGAHPGPTCYRKGGELAITDANLVLGRLIPSQFPSIFGPDANLPLDVEASTKKFELLRVTINNDRPADTEPYTLDQVAAGFIRIANEGMSRPMRTLTEQRGYAPSQHDLCCFGGAGGQHACAIAKGLGIQTVIVPKFSSILSAFGIACADITAEASSPVIGSFQDTNLVETLAQQFDKLREDVAEQLAEQDVSEEDAVFENLVNCHYEGSDTIFPIPLCDDLEKAFVEAHLRETSFNMQRPVLFVGLKTIGTGKSKGFNAAPVDYAVELEAATLHPKKAIPSSRTQTYFEFTDGGKRVETPVYELMHVDCGSLIIGPAILVDSTQTIVVEPYTNARVLSQHVIMEIGSGIEETEDCTAEGELQVDPIMLAVFGNRFMSIAEQMGNLFQKTSISLSIKERLDFSCSIHSTNGALVANAPHIPIHLGSMQYAVQSQHQMWLGKLKPGDVLLSNHPDVGGTHLPDMTVVTPIFDPNDQEKILFYVASRGHHTDIGGSSVTSMNPVATQLWEEGVAVKTFKLVSQGVFHEEGVKELFDAAGRYPGCSATRRIDHNITDLQAAISANTRGSTLVNALFQEFGSKLVLFYMAEIQRLAAKTVQGFLKDTYHKFNGLPLEAVDYMDDGTEICIKITIDPATGLAVFDWTGTGPQTLSCFNCPVSISYAAIIYCLRSMIKSDIPMPLNQGVLDPITNIVPSGTFVNPTGDVAVSGSTISSQRLVDVILKAFRAAAGFQGDANSLGFGTGGKDGSGNVIPGFAYGEAVGGGTGAGDGWHGKNSVAVHSTNTRLTDIEVIEARTPMMLKEFGIKKGSGGTGKWNGGMSTIHGRSS